MENTSCSRKMLNRHRFRPHSINSLIHSSPQPSLDQIERKSPRVGLQVQFFNSSASSQNLSGETKESVTSRLELVDGDTEQRSDTRLYFRYVDEGYITLTAANLSPVPKSGQGEVLIDEHDPESPAEPPQLKEEVKHEPQFSFAGDEVCVTQSGLPSEPLHIGECLEEDVEGAWDIGQPIFESSACHSFVNLDVVAENNRLESEDVPKDVMEPGRPSLTTDSILSTSWETTILPPVQVKSKVVVPGQVSSQLAVDGRSLRSVTFNEAHWKQKKDQYINLVRRHFMFENPKAGHDAMSDLVNLMSHVTKQSAGSRSASWKHPSDFTRRNYQTQFGNEDAKMSLQEWQDKNGKTYKRFSNLPKIFKRSWSL